MMAYRCGKYLVLGFSISILSEGPSEQTFLPGLPTSLTCLNERAKLHPQNNQLQAARLRSAIRLFQEKLAKGDSWPENSGCPDFGGVASSFAIRSRGSFV
jgi:hypothetical protein